MPEAEAPLPPPESRPQQAPALIVAALAFILPPLTLYGPKLVAVPAMMALAGIFFLPRRRPDCPRGPALVLLASLAALVLWGAVSTLWSAGAGRSSGTAVVLAAVLAGALGLLAIGRAAEAANATVGRLLVAGLIAAMLLCAAEYLTGGAGLIWLKGLKPNPEEQFSLLNRGLAVLALLAWPAALWLYRRGQFRAALGLMLAAAAIVVFGNGISIKIALATGFVAAAFAALVPRFALRGFAVVVVVSLFAAPLVPGELGRHFDAAPGGVSGESLGHRLIIWQFTADRISERPVTGWGLDAARGIPGADTRVVIRTEPTVREAAVLPNHPHNAALQIWLELGLVGALLVAFAFAAAAVVLERHLPDPPERAAVVGQMTTAVGIACLSFGLWQAWWLIALVLIVAITRAVMRGTTDREPPARRRPRTGTAEPLAVGQVHGPGRTRFRSAVHGSNSLAVSFTGRATDVG